MPSRQKSNRFLFWIAIGIVIMGSVIVIAVINSDTYQDMKYMRTPKYEVAEHKGAEFCKTCHSEIYSQWIKHSRHAVATTNKNFYDTLSFIKNNFFLNFMMGEESCYACHGVKGSNEGINCEICHGPAEKGMNIRELHGKQFTPGLSILRKEVFCAKCHELFPPLMSPYSQWKDSQAAKEGLTCQKCHMAADNGIAYHGFDSIAHNPDIYQGDLIIRDLNFSFPSVNVIVENRIKSHGVPVGGPSRVLVLEMHVIDDEEKGIHMATKTFYRKFALMPKIVGGMPTDEVIEDTQLRSLEARPVSFILPATIKGKVSKISLMLKFYDVADQYQGHLEKAHWISGPLAQKTLEIK